jgi:hypothetical protein
MKIRTKNNVINLTNLNKNDPNNSTLSKQQYFGYFCAKLDKFLKKERNKKVPHSSEMQSIYVKIVCGEFLLRNQRR